MAERDYVSIIWAHHSANPHRVELAEKSLNSLIESVDYPAEIVVVDNGGDFEFSKWLLEQTDKGRITHYLRNADNIFHGEARNYAIGFTKGKYIAVLDNDMKLEKGWLSEGVEFLNATEKLLYTPVNIIGAHASRKYLRDPITVNGKTFKVNKRAGSNCWMMKREDWEKIGGFENHLIAGHHWTNRYSKKGYLVAVAPEQKAFHGVKESKKYRGYQRKRIHIDITKSLLDGTKIKP